MTYNDIINILDNINIDFIVVDDASLVIQGLKNSCDKIKISTNNIIDIDKIANIEIVNNYLVDSYKIINNYKFESLESILANKRLNPKINKKDIELIDLYLSSIDNTRYEKALNKEGFKLIAGVDEVGRGPLVGPVVACCVILPNNYYLEGLTDSKKLTDAKRRSLKTIIEKDAISYGYGVVENDIIDEVNIYEATKLAMKEAINNLKITPDHILIDAVKLDIDIPTTSIIKGDLKSITISAASILAKVYRDDMLDKLHELYPEYDFINNKGYPTKKHVEAIYKHGILKEHRKTFAPVKDYIKDKKNIYNDRYINN